MLSIKHCTLLVLADVTVWMTFTVLCHIFILKVQMYTTVTVRELLIEADWIGFTVTSGLIKKPKTKQKTLQYYCDIENKKKYGQKGENTTLERQTQARTLRLYAELYMKSSDAKASKCHLTFSSKIIIFIKLVYLSSVISLKWQ